MSTRRAESLSMRVNGALRAVANNARPVKGNCEEQQDLQCCVVYLLLSEKLRLNSQARLEQSSSGNTHPWTHYIQLTSGRV
jgi:hypothetical protein